MKKLISLIIMCFIFTNLNLYAGNMSIGEKDLVVEQKVAEFSQQSDWINLDSNIDYVGFTQLEYSQEEVDQMSSYFDIFDYEPNTDNTLIVKESLQDIISIKSEMDVNISVKYNDKYKNPILSGYPKLYYRKQNSFEAWNEIILTEETTNVYTTNILADYGSFDYYIVADNENYPTEYITETKNFVVTERPHSFINLNPSLQDGKGNTENNLEFSWTAQKGVETDILKYTLYLGTSEDSMKQYDLATQHTYLVNNLSPRTKYYWKVEVENQYGAKLLNPTIYNFVTLGEIKRVYNAPNPFNPQKGQKTKILFEMPTQGSAEILIYSEYGDKIYHTSIDNLQQGNNEVLYDGRDDNGNILYNGTYLCVVKKKYSGNTKTERCRLLIIK